MGNKNIAYFHHKATKRQRRNCIKYLQAQLGLIATIDDQIGDIFLNHFQNLFRAEDIHISLMDHINVTHLSQSDQYILVVDVTSDEIFTVVKQLGLWKAPEPDGLHAGFYKNNWAIVVDIS